MLIQTPSKTPQTLYNGVQLLGDRPDLSNIEKIDLGALPMISRMQQVGLQIDPTLFERMAETLTLDMDAITERVHEMTGHYINLDSGDQKADLLFKKLGIKQPKVKMTKSGKRESVEDEVLTRIQHEHPVVPLMQEYMECSKLRGTYAIPIPKLARKTAHGKRRLYPNFGTTRIPSGRLNCKEPNLLAMPNRTDRAREMCEGFITDPGWCYLSVDESQIEPRVVAHRSGDPGLCHIYENDEDIYSDFATAAFKLKDERWECTGYHGTPPLKELFPKTRTPNLPANYYFCDNPEHINHGWHYPTVHKKKQRFPAKTCILASIYDVTGAGLAEQMPVVCKNCEKEATKHDCDHFQSLWQENNCQDLINAFYIKYVEILTMRKLDHSRARRYGYVWDDWGRILHIAAVKSVLEWVVSAALREIGNFPIQSTAQGTVKLTMAQVDDEFVDMGVYGDVCNPLLQIHDELLFECREGMADEIGGHVANRFENCVKLRVPIKASIAKADCWGKMPK